MITPILLFSPFSFFVIYIVFSHNLPVSLLTSMIFNNANSSQLFRSNYGFNQNLEKVKAADSYTTIFTRHWAKFYIDAMTDFQFGTLKPLFTTLNRFASLLENSLKHKKLNERHPKLFSHTYL